MKSMSSALINQPPGTQSCLLLISSHVYMSGVYTFSLTHTQHIPKHIQYFVFQEKILINRHMTDRKTKFSHDQNYHGKLAVMLNHAFRSCNCLLITKSCGNHVLHSLISLNVMPFNNIVRFMGVSEKELDDSQTISLYTQKSYELEMMGGYYSH